MYNTTQKITQNRII